MSTIGDSHMLARLNHLHEDIHLAQFIVRSLSSLETSMSDLTDKLDAALVVLQSEAVSVENLVAANGAASDVLKGQLATAQAGQAADQVELQKAIDALAAVNAGLQGNPVVVPPPAPPAPPVVVDPNAPPTPAV